MKLVKQSKLFFKQGNSDKAYEIDLAEVGTDAYVVNFRYGRRNGTMKEGTKTTTPASLSSAEHIFDSLEAEKKRKGYQTADETFLPLPEINLEDYPLGSSENAILQRLRGDIDAQNPFKTKWKTSRVIWRAGELRIKEAVPFIISLSDRGDEMQLYASLWALARIADSTAERTFRVYFSNQKYSEKVRRVAGEGLVQILKEDALKVHLGYYFDRLPESIKTALEASEDISNQLTFEEQQHDYSYIVDLYALSIANPSLKAYLVDALGSIPLKPSFFKSVRQLAKIAELRDDFKVLGMLAYRFERTPEMFKKPKEYHYHGEKTEYNRYVAAIGKSVKIATELKRKDSQLAYSDRTRAYFIRRNLRNLKKYGQNKQSEYVKFAVSILTAYNSKTDFKASFTQTQFIYKNGYRNWENIQKSYPEYSDAVLMNLILFGAGDRIKLERGSWVNTNFEVISSSNQTGGTNYIPPIANNPNTPEGGILNKVFDSIFGLFSKPIKSEIPSEALVSETTEAVEETAKPVEEKNTSSPKQREELYPELWDKFPQAYIQLLLKAKVDLIHQFALERLTEHIDYEQVKKKIDIQLIKQLLASNYQIPAQFALDLVKEKLRESRDKDLTLALLDSPLLQARELAITYIEQGPSTYFGDSALIIEFIFSSYVDVRKWVDETLQNQPLTDVLQQLLVGRFIAKVAALNENTTTNNEVITDASGIILKVCPDALRNIGNQVIVDLLEHQLEATQVFAVKIIIFKNAEPAAETLCSLLSSPFEQVRKAGSELLTELKPLVDSDSAYATSIVNFLVPLLMRKESYEGLHQEIADILSTQLVNHLHSVETTTIIRLIHSNYRPAQDFGSVLLNKYIDPNLLSIRQIVDFSNHEQLVYRTWSWNYFNQNISRIKFEREESISMLDSKWDDSRKFAINYFKDKFQAEDWSPEVLIGIADSVRPDIETFGRELIGRFFEEDQGEEYLLKLSQHPSVGVQLFATNYLERYAADDILKLKKLNFYFRSVLTRVNKGRNSKARVFKFLHQEAIKSPETAFFVAEILRDVSATVAIQDKAKCVGIMQDLQERYEGLDLPIRIVEFEER